MHEWIRVASVTTGGKRYFYVRYDSLVHPFKKRQSIVWNRQVHAWECRENDTLKGYASTPRDAKRNFDHA